MTYRELMTQTLREVSNEPVLHIEHLLAKLFKGHESKLDEEIPREKREELQQDFRKEASGILAWYVRQHVQDTDLVDHRAREYRKENDAMWGRKR